MYMYRIRKVKSIFTKRVRYIYKNRVMPQKYAVIDYICTVNQKGGGRWTSEWMRSGTPEASHGRVNEAEGDLAPDVVQGATVQLAILL